MKILQTIQLERNKNILLPGTINNV